MNNLLDKDKRLFLAGFTFSLGGLIIPRRTWFIPKEPEITAECIYYPWASDPSITETWQTRFNFQGKQRHGLYANKEEALKCAAGYLSFARIRHPSTWWPKNKTKWSAKEDKRYQAEVKRLLLPHGLTA